MPPDASPPLSKETAGASRFDESPLRRLAAGIRRYIRLAGIGRIAVWSGIALAAAIVLDLFLTLPPAGRIVCDIAILVGVAVLAISHGILRPAKITTDSATLELETAHPECGQMLRTARDASRPDSAVPPDFKQELFRRTQAHLSKIDPASHFPKRPARRWLLAGIAAVIFCAGFVGLHSEARTAFARLLHPNAGITYTQVSNTTRDATFDRNRLPRVEASLSGRVVSPVTLRFRQDDGKLQEVPMIPLGRGRFEATLPAATRSFDFEIVAGDSRPAKGTMECVDPAEFVSSSALVSLPDYTGRPPIAFDTADLETVEGSSAVLHFKMSAAMARASLKLPGGTLIPLEVNGADLTAHVATALGGDTAELTGTDFRGHAVPGIIFKHRIIADALPTIEWIEPTDNIEATAVAEIPVRIRVRDDFGVASYGITLQARGESKEILTRTVEARDLSDLSDMAAAALETFPLTIRDNVRLFAWATDFKPRENPRRFSELRGIDIKPFKKKSGEDAEEEEGGGGGPPPPEEEDVADVEKLIKDQRSVLSDSFPFIQDGGTEAAPVADWRDREVKLFSDTFTLHQSASGEGTWTEPELKLLNDAATEMRLSLPGWQVKQLKSGFDHADAALSNLLQLRKNLIERQRKGKGSGKPKDSKPQPTPQSLTDLAPEAERLAAEERDIAKQLASAPAAEQLAAIRRQQEIAQSDIDELNGRMMDQKDTTPLVLSRMAEAEQLAHEATRESRAEASSPAAQTALGATATALDEIARQLKAMDEANLDQTLAAMAEDAKNAAEAAAPTPPGQAPDSGTGSPPGGQQPSPGAGQSADAGQGSPASGQPDAKPHPPREKTLAQAAREAAANDDILKALAEREKKAGGDSRLEALREETDSANLENQLNQLARGEGDGKQTADELKNFAAALEKEREQLKQSRLENLNQSQQLVAGLLAQAEQPQNPADPPQPGAGQPPAPGLSPGQAQGQTPPPPSQGQGPGQGNSPGQSPGGPPQGLIGQLATSGDPELKRIAKELEKTGPNIPNVKALTAAERRLADLIAEISGLARADSSQGAVSPAYRRAIEDYYRALSDDLDDAPSPR